MTTNESADRFVLIPVPMAQGLACFDPSGRALLNISLPVNVKTISSVQQSSTGTLYVVGYSNEQATNGYPVLLRTNDKGRTWQTSFIARTPASSEVACSATGELYVSINPLRQTFFTTASIVSSTDGGNSWFVVFSQSTTSTWHRLQTIFDRIIYTSEDPQCNFQDLKLGFGGEIFQSRNQGRTWTRALVDTNPVREFCLSRAIHAIIVGNNNEKITAFHISREAYTSTDGITWQKGIGRINFANLSNIVHHAAIGDIFTIPGGASVLRRLNRYSQTLIPLSDIPFTGVDSLFSPTSLAFGKNNRLIMGGFNTNSAYSLDLATLQPTSTTEGEQNTSFDLAISPNPSTDAANMSITLPAPSALRLTLHDALGHEIQTIANSVFSSGKQEFSLSLESLSSGIYFVRCSVDGQVVVRRLAVVR
ncbi:MAG: WD40/YVTN/BNR-like repeat-containing protein [Candidatus Kapaibacteriota bacterium]